MPAFTPWPAISPGGWSAHGAPESSPCWSRSPPAPLLGALIQGRLYAQLEQRRATHLVVLIASLGVLAVMQNIIAAVFTPNILQFAVPWAAHVVSLGSIRLTYTQVLTVVRQPRRLCRA